MIPPEAVDLTAYDAWLFDLDGVVTDTARVHAAAWKAAFDPFLAEEAARTGVPQAPFDPVDEYRRFVDGRPRTDGVRTFLGSRGIHVDEGRAGDPPAARTVVGIADGKNELRPAGPVRRRRRRLRGDRRAASGSCGRTRS